VLRDTVRQCRPPARETTKDWSRRKLPLDRPLSGISESDADIRRHGLAGRSWPKPAERLDSIVEQFRLHGAGDGYDRLRHRSVAGQSVRLATET